MNHSRKARFDQRWVRFGDARALLAGGADGRGGGDGPVLVYLHGFASLPRHQLPLRDDLPVPPGTRFVFPEGPRAVSLPGGPRRAWWLIDRPFRARLRAEPLGMRELAGRSPEGLDAARAHLREVLDGVSRTMAPPGRTVLAGFSQGAMLAADVALRDPRPLAGVALLSGAPMARSAWTEALPRRRGLPVFVAHGRADPLLPFPLAERMAAFFAEGGLDVRFYPHHRGHTFAPEIAPYLTGFLYEALVLGRRGPGAG